LKDQILSFDAIGELLDNGKKKSALAQKNTVKIIQSLLPA
jgi:hypothetical protein